MSWQGWDRPQITVLAHGVAGQQPSRQATLVGLLSVRRASSAPLGGVPLATLAAAVGLEALTGASLRGSGELGSPSAADPGVVLGSGTALSPRCGCYNCEHWEWLPRHATSHDMTLDLLI